MIKQTVTHKQLDCILVWHTRMGYTVECSFMAVRDEHSNITGWCVTWFNDARRLEYWMSGGERILD